MKKLSLQWRITLMTAALVCITCVLMNCLISLSGKHYMESIVNGLSSYSYIENSIDPESKKADPDLTIIVNGAQESFSTTNWYITVAVTLFAGILAYFVSGHAIKP